MLTPGAAVVLDTETTGLAGFIVEIAIIDTATSQALVDTLVNPIDGRTTKTNCADRCLSATGHSCECACGGANHGASHGVGLTL